MSALDYPLPSYAAYIWIGADGDLRVALPGEVSERNHLLRFPAVKCQTDDTAATAGWAALLRVLKDRQQASEPIKIGMPGGITGAQLDEMMRGKEITKVGKREAPANLSLEELGL